MIFFPKTIIYVKIKQFFFIDRHWFVLSEIKKIICQRFHKLQNPHVTLMLKHSKSITYYMQRFNDNI